VIEQGGPVDASEDLDVSHEVQAILEREGRQVPSVRCRAPKATKANGGARISLHDLAPHGL